MRCAPKQEALLRKIYSRLWKEFGPQHWWPGETPFEVAVGAILAQNTAWENAALAIRRLKEGRALSARRMREIPVRRLAGWIRPSGYFNQKARKLKVFVRHLHRHYGGRVERMKSGFAPDLRKKLLTLWGVGPETADSILLYAVGKPFFVVDAYTRRILARHSLIPWNASYDDIQNFFVRNLPLRTALYNEYHALLVALGKRFCHKSQPDCRRCPLREIGRLRLEPAAN